MTEAQIISYLPENVSGMFLVHDVLVALIIIILVITSLNDVTSFFF